MTSPYGDISFILLAAGKGNRMQTDTPKPLIEIAGRSFVGHILKRLALFPGASLTAIVSDARVEAEIKTHAPHTECVWQEEQLGTGHATLMAEKALTHTQGTAVVLFGDSPLMHTAALTNLIETHRAQNNIITLGTLKAQNPGGGGRIIHEGTAFKVVEAKDATPEQKAITEVSTGVFAVQLPHLFTWLKQIKNNNAQHEYYLGDILPLAQAEGQKTGTHVFKNMPDRILGINTPEELAEATEIYNRQIRVAG